ncbi:alpha-amylase family glycosyl hydrolase [Gracilibacillus sp. YIM 98692]|uniref:alpha-amylase family glycosyl hydrolase n=1 Tax=Gracilibacillus sp. YIM 98692 TaxID=2663532 RepID=UPI0013D3FADB|nr:alpha-amylase family glycosyl hydrolase [Gracilibacillus sp. YIM 98692]
MYKYIRQILLVGFLIIMIGTVFGGKVEANQKTDERMYYILVDRFINGNSDNDMDINIDQKTAYHGGDLEGIIDHIPELADLGFTAINVSPVMESSSYHGLDPLDHQSLDPHFGEMEDLKQMVETAHEHDMKVILDFVVSQVNADHPLSELNGKWTANKENHQWGTEVLIPDLQIDDVENYFLNSAAYWIEEVEIDGFHLYVNENTPESFIQAFQERIEEVNEQALLLTDGKSYANDANYLQVNHRLQEKLVNVLKHPGESLESILTEEQLLQGNQIQFIDNAATNRFTHEAVREGFNPVTRWKLALTFLYTIPGDSLIYQGSEVPMDNGAAEPDHRMAEVNRTDEDITRYLDKLSTLREDAPALREGDIELVNQAGAMSVYKRTSADQTMYMAINNDTETKTVEIANMDDGMQLRGLLEDGIVRQQDDGNYYIVLDRETANVFILEEDTGFNWFFIIAMLAIVGAFVGFVITVSVKNKNKVIS